MGFVLWHHQILGVLLLTSMNFHVTLCSPNIPYSFPTSIHLCPPHQSLALLKFKNAFTIDSSASEDYCTISRPKTESWKEGADCCLWDGITCDKLTGYVIGLDLSCSCLLGDIHANNTLFLLPHLRSLNLAFNDFNNSLILSNFGQLTSLMHLNLSSSRFSGLVPSEISHLSKLVLLDLSDSYNQLQFGRHSFNKLLQNLTELTDLVLDNIDMSLVTPGSFLNLSSSLETLSLEACGLQGPLPGNVFHLPNLQVLTLGYNFQLQGSLPKFNWSSPLRILDLSLTGFSGNLPASIGNLNSLVSLDFTTYNFVGSLPASMGNLTKITSMVLYHNNFSGQIPLSLSNLESLFELNLGSNNFSGQIPDVFRNLSKLNELAIDGNRLSGRIPSSLFDLKQLSRLYLSFNQLSGPLHHQGNGQSTLTEINLSNNMLSGAIPPWLFSLPSIRNLDLSYNQLTGQIPEVLSKNLEIIRLGNNLMHGAIPSSIFQLANVTSIDLSSNNFNGTLDLDMFSKLRNLVELHLSDNRLSVEVNLKENSSWPMLKYLNLSSCNINSFPHLLSTQNQLVVLSLSRNNIHGKIPEWLWLLGNASLMFLDLSQNFLTSTVALPMQLNGLQYLDLRFNSIYGSLFPLVNMIQDSSAFSFCFLSGNKLTGQIPSSICNISSLTVLDLSNNSMNGKIPECLSSLDELSVLNLRNNNFSGPIPQNFSNAKFLRNLDLGGNQLEGSLPQSLVSCKKLEVLDLGNNKIIDKFPYWLETLPELQVLILRSNRFYGPLGNPKSRTPFPKLRIIDIASNDFNGPLPRKYFRELKAMMNVDGKLIEEKYMGDRDYQDSMVVTIEGQEIVFQRIPTLFAAIDFSSNRFEGRIPDVIGNLNSLIGLNLSHNDLSNNIPTSLANMTALESLDLSSNKIAGEIPEQLKNLVFLSALNLSYNRLQGLVPQGQFGTFTNDSFLGNPELCGPPLSRQCGNVEAAPPQPSTVQDDNDFSWGFGWKTVMIGYGSGFVTGLSIACMVFMTGEPLWFAKIVDRLINPYYKKARRQNKRRKERRRS